MGALDCYLRLPIKSPGSAVSTLTRLPRASRVFSKRWLTLPMTWFSPSRTISVSSENPDVTLRDDLAISVTHVGLGQ